MFTLISLVFLLATVFQVSSKISAACPYGWAHNNGDCYYVGRGKVSSNEAEKICRALGASFASTSFTSKLGFVQSLLRNIGSSDVSGAWVRDENRQNPNNCTYLDAKSNWRKSQLPCKTKDYDMLYVCSGNEVLKECNGYSCYTISDERWENPCDYGGRYLARIESSEEHQFVTNFLKTASQQAKTLMRYSMFQFDKSIYIDGNDKAHEGVWVYGTGHNMTYFNWKTGEPNNHGYKGEDCIAIDPKNYLWNDVECDEMYHYLCEELDPAMW